MFSFAPHAAMESWQSRFDSFKKGKRVKKGSSSTMLRWPHSSSFLANPDTLAEAGFYFTPSVGNPDAVTCFICRKELSDWEEGDDPFAEHVRRGSSCCWAIARCGLRHDMDEDGKCVVRFSLRLWLTVSFSALCSQTLPDFLLVSSWRKHEWILMVRTGRTTR